MKLLTNDGQQLEIQSAETLEDGALLIKTISAGREELKHLISDEFATKVLVITERESEVSRFENYTLLDSITEYTGGILGAKLYKKEDTQKEKVEKLEAANQLLMEQMKNYLEKANALEEKMENLQRTVEEQAVTIDAQKVTMEEQRVTLEKQKSKLDELTAQPAE